MNNLILNRDFRLPADDFYQIAPLGEFPHQEAGIVQVIDNDACAAMAARFAADKLAPNFPGLLVDFDHQSLDGDQRSEAAGWVLGLEARPTGLWANIRWSDAGAAAVKGGGYRFLSPVWARSDCVDLGNGRFRPARLINAAVTNDPNLKGMVPLSNRGKPLDSKPIIETTHGKPEKGALPMKAVLDRLLNHLGLALDATEEAILEKMTGLPTITAVADVQNSLRDLQAKHDALAANATKTEADLVNRHLADFAAVITEATKPFWTDQLLHNRETALAALNDLVKNRPAQTVEPAPTRQPLHNRATARPVIPGQSAADTDNKAVKIRNRAQEIAKAEGVPFSAAFRRAEKELVPA